MTRWHATTRRRRRPRRRRPHAVLRRHLDHPAPGRKAGRLHTPSTRTSWRGREPPRRAGCARLRAWRSRRPTTTPPGSRSGSSRGRARRSPARRSATGASTPRASETVERVRRLLCHEPRGHADMYGGFLVPPDDDGADLGVLFWHKDGYSTACGHGTIALGAWAVESGRVPAPDDGDGRRHDRRAVRPRRGAGAAPRRRGRERRASATCRRSSIARGVAAAASRWMWPTAGRSTPSCPPSARAARSCRTICRELIAAGREVKAALEGSEVARHPDDDRLSGIYGTVIHEELGPLHQRNVAIFADGEVDRSPTGSATSARTALLAADGALAGGQTWRNDSIVGTTFNARGDRPGAGRAAHRGRGHGLPHRRASVRAGPARPARTGFVLR